MLVSAALVSEATQIAGGEKNLASILGVSQQTVIYWRKNAHCPRYDMQVKMRELIAEANGEPLDEGSLIASEYPLLPLEATEQDWLNRLMAVLVDRRFPRLTRINEAARQLGGRA